MLFGKGLQIEIAYLQNLKEDVHPGFHIKEFVDNDHIFAGYDTITGLEITFLISDRNLELTEYIFKLIEIMLGIFDHVL